MLGSKDMKDMYKVLGDLVKPEAHRHKFCCALQSKLWYKVFALKNVIAY